MTSASTNSKRREQEVPQKGQGQMMARVQKTSKVRELGMVRDRLIGEAIRVKGKERAIRVSG